MKQKLEKCDTNYENLNLKINEQTVVIDNFDLKINKLNEQNEGRVIVILRNIILSQLILIIY
jgi:hypothetical protein